MEPADRAAVSEVFHRLKPLCTAVMKNASVDNINELRCAIISCPQNALQSMQAYIIFPLEAHLRAPQTRSKIQGELANCLKALLKHIEIDSINIFFRLFTLIFSHLYDKDEKNLLSSINEELKMSYVECAVELLKQTSSEVKEHVYEKKNMPWLSQGVYVCVQLQQHEKYRALRIAAIECLMLLNQTHDDVKASSEIKEKVADVFATMFPGILAGLTSTIMGDPKQGHTVIVRAVEAWWRLLVLVLNDSSSSEDMLHPKTLLELVHQATVRYKQPRPEITPEDLESVLQSAQSRSGKWQRAAADKVVRPIVVVTESLQKHEHPLVRRTLAEACQELLKNNASVLSGAVPALIDALVVLSEDTEPSVSNFASTAVTNFSLRLSSGGQSLIPVIEKRLHSIVESLPNLLHCRHDEDQQLSALHQLGGYLRLLGTSHLKHLTQSPLHCQKLFNVLLDAAELDSSGISLLEDYALRDVNMPITRVPWRSMRHLFALPVVAALENVCHILGSNGHLDSLADTLLQLVPERTEAVLILNMIIAGVATQDQSNWPVVRSILDVYLEPSVWYRPLFVTNSVPLGAAQANLIHACLLVEGLGIMHGKIPQDCVPQFFLRSLYVTLERAGSTQKVLSDAGMEAARAMSSGDISSLVWSNADYLSFRTAHNLQLPERQQGALSVLGVLLRHSRLENLPQLRDMVGMVISQTGNQDDEQSLAQLQVMRAFVGCVRGWLKNRQPSTSKSDSSSHSEKVDLVAELLEYRRNKHHQPEDEPENLSLDEISKRFAEEAPDAEEQEDYTKDEQGEKHIPPHVAAVREVLHRCIHALPRSRASRHQVVSLEALTDGVHCLKAHSTVLLRLAHKIWEAMSPLFGHSEPRVLARCFGLLCALTSSSGDFLRSRCIKLALPPLFDFMRRSAQDSMLQDSASAYRFTQAYKLQLSLLEGLGPLAASLHLSGLPLRELVTVCAPYLSSQQPRPLQEACVALYKTLCHVDADVVWFRLICLWSTSCELVPPSADLGLEIHRLPGNCAEDSEYKKNVSLIMQYLNDLTLSK